MVVITHSLAVARRICNRIAVIDAGHIVEEGLTADVFANPQSKVARELLEWGFEGIDDAVGHVAAGPFAWGADSEVGSPAEKHPAESQDAGEGEVAHG